MFLCKTDFLVKKFRPSKLLNQSSNQRETSESSGKVILSNFNETRGVGGVGGGIVATQDGVGDFTQIGNTLCTSLFSYLLCAFALTKQK